MRGSGRRRLGLALLIAGIVTLATTAAAGAQGPPPPGGADTGTHPRVQLVGQDPWVGPNGTLTMRLALTDAPPDTRLTFRLYGDTSTAGRNRYLQTMRGEQLGSPIRAPLTVPVENLPAAPDGSRIARFEVATDRLPLVGFRLNSPGVYPLGVALSVDNREVDSFMTSLVRLPTAASDENPPLGLAVVVGLQAPPALQTDGRVDLGDQAAPLTDLARAISSHPDVPISLDADPETVAALAGRDAQTGTTVVADLAASLGRRQLLQAPYVRLDLGTWSQPELQSQLVRQLQAGAATLRSGLGVAPSPRTWVVDETTTPEAVNHLRQLGVDQVVVPEDQLTPLDPRAFGVTLTRSFDLDTGGGAPTRAVMADTALRFHETATDSAALNAQQLLGDLAVLYLDRPGWRRGAVLNVPHGAQSASFVDALLAALQAGAATPADAKPLVTALTVDDLFASVEPAGTAGGRGPTPSAPRGEPVLTRGLLTAPAASPGTYPVQLGFADRTLAGYRSMNGPDPARVRPLEQLVLVSGARQLDAQRRQSYLDAAVAVANGEADAVRFPEQQQVTLTSRQGSIPLDVHNDNPQPVDARITVASDKLEFPGGASFTSRLQPGSNRIDIAVEARGSGAFPVDVALTSPDNTLRMSQGRFTVRSTAVSGIGLALSIGAGLFLALWWIRNFRGTRRRQRQAGVDNHPARAVNESLAPGIVDRPRDGSDVLRPATGGTAATDGATH